ncbi:MAG: MMPL family transporter [Pseudomonadota bacterium]
MKHDNAFEQQPVIARIEEFNIHSGNILERALFNNRLTVVVICALITAILSFQAAKLSVNASFERMIPTRHPYIANYFQNKEELAGLGNSVVIAVEALDGAIYNPTYLEILRQINDEVFFIPGVDRSAMKSLWTPSTRWAEVTEDGLTGGPVIPDNYHASQTCVNGVCINVNRSGEIGQLVASNFKSTIVYVPLLEVDAETKNPLDYRKLSDMLEALRKKYDSDRIKLHITGFAKMAGDLMEGMQKVLLFFGVATLLATLMVYWFTRCIRSTVLVVACSLIAVVWQLGLVESIGLELDPYSMLVPFLIFSIGMSHGAQKMNGIMQDIGRGTHRVVAARYTFRRLFLAGLTALLCDAVGFGVLMIIRIGVIQQLAIMASIGVGVLIFTNLVLLPILLSYTGVDKKAAERSLRVEMAELSGKEKYFLWKFLDAFTHRKWATLSIVCCAILGLAAFAMRSDLQIGDLDPGAPELRPDSRYNIDNAFIVGNYASSSDVFVVMVKTPEYLCSKYSTLIKTDALEWELQQLPGVESTKSMTTVSKQAIVGMSEGNLKWYEIVRNQEIINSVTTRAPVGALNQNCSMLPLLVFLKDHKADTLSAVVSKVEAFALENNSSEVSFLLAAGNAGIEAATNIVVKHSMEIMLYWVYSAVVVLCFITFKSWKAVLVAVIPLVLTSLLCEALMAWLKIGVKVATLPVVALGVGIGVDYALYVLTVVLAQMRAGMTLSEAYYRSLLFTGKVVILTGLTLSIGISTWAFSPIKFQADMGILLSFMFMWNMIGALILLPALAHFLLLQNKKATLPVEHKEKVVEILTKNRFVWEEKNE